MWVFTVDGFFSAVQSGQDENVLMIRSRFKKDLEAIKAELGADKVHSSEYTDYPHRVFATHDAWAKYLERCAKGIDYTNFKDHVLKNTESERCNRYHAVWAAMAGYYG